MLMDIFHDHSLVMAPALDYSLVLTLAPEQRTGMAPAPEFSNESILPPQSAIMCVCAALCSLTLIEVELVWKFLICIINLQGYFEMII